ncbi:2,3-bisphosphoglycerate-independent phosphoglycerate mutase [Galendromus occidentalis]|uniref:2,3-bisphosphoglycerate-independent phosphoglycerate mutase n=1 Tax=Galendromus occidentalis TaxID=34638 RepID=A0AAJ7WID3_9ACAR|nr:2,3-bisphosphoglycerate-independent phosphoglycerate mutase [Galendromus occidentalis]
MAKVCLIVIDGWGLSDTVKGNAIANATAPVMSGFAKAGPENYLTLDASGLAVGLPDGMMGNSEVGHLNIGAGRVLFQDIVRINKDVSAKRMHENKYFAEACNRAKGKNGRLHLMGLVSDGGVHAHIDHLFALLDGAQKLGVPNVYVHFFGDGRDTRPTSATTYIKQVIDRLASTGFGKLSSIVGRYYAMDRDKRWERIQIAFEGLVQGKGEKTSLENVISLVEGRYNAADVSQKQTDEFLKPIIINEEGLIKDGDTVVFFNYRSDRARQLSQALGEKPPFETSVIPKDIELFTMTQYKKEFNFKMLYPPVVPSNVLAEWLAKKSVKQFHCAETEKYAHVTFFFNGGQEKNFEGEERCMVPSPKVATYDLQPEMNCQGVADELCKAIESGTYAFTMCNFAPPDMVGHTGKYDAAVIACTATDKAIGQVAECCKKNNVVLLVTADHGNAELMMDEAGNPITQHTTNRVPFVMQGGSRKFAKPTHNAALCDVAPTVLDLLNFEKPEDMGGVSLLQK